MLARLGWDDPAATRVFADQRDQDIRMALVSLCGAGVVRAGLASSVGDPVGGWFWMPPVDMWADWARAGLLRNIDARRRSGHPDLA